MKLPRGVRHSPGACSQADPGDPGLFPEVLGHSRVFQGSVCASRPPQGHSQPVGSSQGLFCAQKGEQRRVRSSRGLPQLQRLWCSRKTGKTGKAGRAGAQGGILVNWACPGGPCLSLEPHSSPGIAQIGGSQSQSGAGHFQDVPACPCPWLEPYPSPGVAGMDGSQSQTGAGVRRGSQAQAMELPQDPQESPIPAAFPSKSRNSPGLHLHKSREALGSALPSLLLYPVNAEVL